MRTSFIEQLISEAENNDQIFLLTGDLGFSVLEPFAKKFPDRYLNVGIAEQNMAGIAAGLALEGFCVYMYSIGNFPTLRCIEQIRYDICYHNLNVKIIAVGGGFSYGSLGPSHHATEELGMLRTIPGLVVCAPGDPVETRAVTTFSCNYRGPVYIRLGKAGEPNVHITPVQTSLGEILCLRKGRKNAVLSTGSMLKYAQTFIENNNIDASLYSFPFVKPIQITQLSPILTQYENIITIEEHQLDGGFGSAILEQANNLLGNGTITCIPKLQRVGIDNQFFSVAGSQQFLRELGGVKLDQTHFIS